MGETDLNPTKGGLILSDSTSYEFLVESGQRADRAGDETNTHEFIEQGRVDHGYCSLRQRLYVN